MVMFRAARRSVAAGPVPGPAWGGTPQAWTFRAEQVTKVFGTLHANNGITLQVEPDEVYGLLGPNGAGKSTLVRQIIRPTALIGAAAVARRVPRSAGP